MTNATQHVDKPEQLDNRNRKAREIVEHFNKRLGRDDSRLGEAYLKVEREIAFRRVSGADRNYGILIKPLPNWREYNVVNCGFSGNKNAIEGIDYRKKMSVFPREVEFVQYGDEIVRSFVGLEIFDSSLIGRGNPLYFFYSRVGQIVEGSDIAPNRKVSAGWTCSAVSLGKCNHEQIKTAPETVDNDSGFSINNCWDSLYIAEANDFLSRVRIQIADETIRVIVSPELDLPLKDWEVGYGPVNIGVCI